MARNAFDWVGTWQKEEIYAVREVRGHRCIGVCSCGRNGVSS